MREKNEIIIELDTTIVRKNEEAAQAAEGATNAATSALAAQRHLDEVTQQLQAAKEELEGRESQLLQSAESVRSEMYAELVTARDAVEGQLAVAREQLTAMHAQCMHAATQLQAAEERREEAEQHLKVGESDPCCI